MRLTEYSKYQMYLFSRSHFLSESYAGRLAFFLVNLISLATGRLWSGPSNGESGIKEPGIEGFLGCSAEGVSKHWSMGETV